MILKEKQCTSHPFSSQIRVDKNGRKMHAELTIFIDKEASIR
jgi:hypothetical protein